jgi:Sigma-70 region 2
LVREQPNPRELERFLAERADHLMRTAVLLTGSHEAGQDLLQTALERLIRHWGTLRGDPEGYLRRTLYNLAGDGFRRQGRLQRKLALLRAGAQAPADPTAGVDLRDALVRILLQLPPRAAGGPGAQVLGAAVRGRDRGAARLFAGHRQVGHLPGAGPAQGTRQPLAPARARKAAGMNTDVEELLAEGMQRFTAEVQAPAGLARTASRLHQRRLAVRAAVGALPGPGNRPGRREAHRRPRHLL